MLLFSGRGVKGRNNCGGTDEYEAISWNGTCHFTRTNSLFKTALFALGQLRDPGEARNRAFLLLSFRWSWFWQSLTTSWLRLTKPWLMKAGQSRGTGAALTSLWTVDHGREKKKRPLFIFTLNFSGKSRVSCLLVNPLKKNIYEVRAVAEINPLSFWAYFYDHYLIHKLRDCASQQDQCGTSQWNIYFTNISQNLYKYI